MFSVSVLRQHQTCVELFAAFALESTDRLGDPVVQQFFDLFGTQFLVGNLADRKPAAGRILRIVIGTPIAKRGGNDIPAARRTLGADLFSRAQSPGVFSCKRTDLHRELSCQILIPDLYGLPADKILELCAVVVHVDGSVGDQ